MANDVENPKLNKCPHFHFLSPGPALSTKGQIRSKIYLPNPRCTLVLGTAPWRNSSLEFMRMSWFPATISTPSLIFLMKGLVVVDTTDMENSALSPPW